MVNGRWSDGYLDEPLLHESCRILPWIWLWWVPVADTYFERPRDVRMVYNYLRTYGVAAVMRKTASRRAESSRNACWMSLGAGEVLESRTLKLKTGAKVLFVVPAGPQSQERVVLSSALVGAWTDKVAPPADLITGPVSVDTEPPSALPAWSSWSGTPVPEAEVQLALKTAARAVRATPAVFRVTVPARLRTPSRIRTFQPPAGVLQEVPSRGALLWGAGNYSKTVVLPNIRRHLLVTCIADVDPLQLATCAGEGLALCSEPAPSKEQLASASALFVATYHHTHADLARAALDAGVPVIVEKPPATTLAAVDALERLVLDGGRLAVAYQRRHSSLLRYARVDLGLGQGQPVSYHAIVFEEPLPGRHWYRWPNSRSRLLSNGVHWFDEFLSLNDYCDVESAWACRPDSRSDVLSATVALTNGAVLTLVLTSQGANRIGLQDQTQLRTRGRTVTITDGRRYVAESGRRVVRRVSVRRLDAYATMYGELARKIVNDEPLDDAQTALAATRLALRLEQSLK